MKKAICLLLALCLVAGAGFAQVRFVGGKFTIEKGAKVRVGVDSDRWGAAIVETWDRLNPEYKGLVEYMNMGSEGATDVITQLQNETADVVLVIDSQIARNQQSIAVLDGNLAKLGKEVGQPVFFKKANPDAVRFIPISYDGMVFSWNKTMMEKLGLDTTDKSPKDGLPDAFDTWEEIFALARKWASGARPSYNKTQVNIVFPMALDEVYSGYPNVTAGGWEIYAEGEPAKPGFEKASFAAGLEFIKAASEAMISVEANGMRTPGSSMGWRWDDALNNQLSPFGLVGTWMDVAGAEVKGGYDMKFGPLPTWKGKHLTPIVKTKGFVINGFTKYPGAASELMRQLYSKDFLQAMVNNTSYIPALAKGAKVAPSFASDPNKAEIAAGFAFGYPEPAMSLPGNKNKKAMDAYYQIGLNTLYKGIWDGSMTVKEAQAEAVRLAAAWYAENNK